MGTHPTKPPGKAFHALESKTTFEVVLIKKTSPGPHAAVSADFRRVKVEAGSTLSAQWDDSVEAAMREGEGWLRTGFVTLPGQVTDPEIKARARAFETSHEQDMERVKWV